MEKIKMLRDIGRPGYPGTVNGEKMGPYRTGDVLEVGVGITFERAILFIDSVMAEVVIEPPPLPPEEMPAEAPEE